MLGLRWGAKIAILIAMTFLRDVVILGVCGAAGVFLAKLTAGIVGRLIPDTGAVLHMLHTFFGSEYVWITTIAVVCAILAEKQAARLAGAKEIGPHLGILAGSALGA